jgi:RHS repeat-associated protein
VSERGFSDHEHLDDQQLIHMNGRAYDYNLGRFLSVDPFITDPKDSQSLNPYSYVRNNPLSRIDPTGYMDGCTSDGVTSTCSGRVISNYKVEYTPIGSHISRTVEFTATVDYTVKLDDRGIVVSSNVISHNFNPDNGTSKTSTSGSFQAAFQGPNQGSPANIIVAQARPTVESEPARQLVEAEPSQSAGAINYRLTRAARERIERDLEAIGIRPASRPAGLIRRDGAMTEEDFEELARQEHYCYQNNFRLLQEALNKFAAGEGPFAAGGMTNAEVRAWYAARVRTLDTSGPLTAETAARVHAARNALKAEARGMMADRAAAAELGRTQPLRSFEYYVEKYTQQGFSGDALWERIIQGGTTPNAAVNAAHGVR